MEPAVLWASTYSEPLGTILKDRIQEGLGLGSMTMDAEIEGGPRLASMDSLQVESRYLEAYKSCILAFRCTSVVKYLLSIQAALSMRPMPR